MVRKHRGIHGFWVYHGFIICPPVVGVRECPNYSINKQNRIWCVNIGEYMVFGSIVGSDYYI